MAAKLFHIPYPTAFTSNGLAVPGAVVRFYEVGTLTPKQVFSDADLTVPYGTSVTASGAGRFPQIYMDTDETYRFRIFNAAGAQLEEVLEYTPGTIVATIGSGDALDAISEDSGAALVGFKQAGTGAVSRDAAAKLREIEINVNDFGAVPNVNTLAQAQANYTAIRAALAWVLREEATPVLERKKTLVFGEGEYFIAGNSPLMFNRSEMLALFGGYRFRRGFTIKGKGRRSTILRLVSEGNGERWFYSTYDAAHTGNPNNDQGTAVADFITFEGLTFRGTSTFQTQATNHKTNGFYFESYGFEKFINFFDCTFELLDKCFQVEGYGNVDHNRFYGCLFFEIRDYCVRFNNNQAVGWGFYGVDTDAVFGNVIEIGPDGGGDLVWVGGTVSLYPEVDASDVPLVSQAAKGFIKWDNSTLSTGPSSGPGNSKFTLHQLRFEIYDASQAIVRSIRTPTDAYGNLDVTFSDCTFANAHQYTSGGPPPLVDYTGVDLQNAATVKFVRCDLSYHFTWTLRKHDPQLAFEDCQFLHKDESPIVNTQGLAGRCSIIAGNGGISARGTRARRNVTNGSYGTTMVADFNKGAVTQAVPLFSAQVKDPNLLWPHVGAVGEFDIYLAAGTVIRGFTAHKPAETVGSPTADVVFGLFSHSYANLGVNTAAQSQNNPVLAQQHFATPYVVPAAPNNYVKWAAGGTSATTPWTSKVGSLYLDLA